MLADEVAGGAGAGRADCAVALLSVTGCLAVRGASAAVVCGSGAPSSQFSSEASCFDRALLGPAVTVAIADSDDDRDTDADCSGPGVPIGRDCGTVGDAASASIASMFALADLLLDAFDSMPSG